MASPAVGGVVEGGLTSAGTNLAVTLPGGGTAADMYIVIIAKGSVACTINALTDWTEILDENVAAGLAVIRYTGSGVPSNPTFVQSASSRSVWCAYRITDSDESITPDIGTTATGSSTTPNPPSVTVTSGPKDILAIAFFARGGEEADDDTWLTAFPTNYTDGQVQKAGGIGGSNLAGILGAAARQVSAASSEDPGTFTIATGAWRANTIAIHPVPPPPPLVDLTVAPSSMEDGPGPRPIGGFWRKLAVRIYQVVGGPQTQTITLDARLDRTRQIFAPTLVYTQNITLTARLDRSRSIFAPTVSPGAVSITIGARLDRSRSIFAPTVAPQAVTITLPFTQRTRSIFAPTLSPQPVTITLTARLDRTRSIFAPTVTPQPVTITLPFTQRTRSIFAPTLSPQAVTVTLPFTQRTRQIFAPTVSAGGTLSITLDAREDRTRSIFAPTVTRGAVSITLPFTQRTRSIFAPTVAPQAVTISLARVDRTRQIFSPTFTFGAITVTLQGRTDRTRQIFAPTVAAQAVGISLARQDRTRTIFAPTLARGAVTVSLPFVVRSRNIFQPQIGEVVPLFTLQRRIGFPGLDRGWEDDDDES